jgi:hypothetical protein
MKRNIEAEMLKQSIEAERLSQEHWGKKWHRKEAEELN